MQLQIDELNQNNIETIYSNVFAFAAVTKDDEKNIITWGDSKCGGDSSKVANELNDNVIDNIYSTWKAFATFEESASASKHSILSICFDCALVT